MADGHVLVIDAGTSAIRCLVFDGAGEPIGHSARGWRFAPPDGPYDLAREFDPDETWETISGLAAEALEAAGIVPDDLAAVTATSQRQGVVFLDRAGREVYAGPNLDLRAVFEGAAIDDELGERVYHTTGHTPSLLFAPAKLRWMRDHRPEAYSEIATVLTLADWILYRLTGERVSEPSLAAEVGLLDISSRLWCEDLTRDAGVDVPDPATLVEAGTVVSRVANCASSHFDLPEGIPVVVAAADTQAGLLGLGTAEPGQVGIVAGWSTPLQLVTDGPVLSPEGRTWAGCFPAAGRWVLESSAGPVGNTYRWLRDTLYPGDESAYDLMNRDAATIPPGAEGTVAFLGPPRMDMSRLGLRAGGLLFPVPITFNEPTRVHLVRACLEATAYTTKANLEQTEGLYRSTAVDIAVGGGMTATTTFLDILANVLGREIKVSMKGNVSAYGAYQCAAVGLGEHDTVHEAALSSRPNLYTIEPSPVESSEYQDLYQEWLAKSRALEEIEL